MSFFENNRLIELIKGYIETRIELIKLDFKETLEGIFNRIFSFLLIAGLFIIGLLFILFGLSQILNIWLESKFVGYFIIGGITILLSFIFMKNQKNKR